MVHIVVLSAFTSAVCSALISYQQHGPAVLVGGMLGPIVVLQMSVHAKRARALAVLLIALAFGTQQLVLFQAANLDARYASGFSFVNKHKLNAPAIIEDYPSYKFAGNQYVARILGTEARVQLQTQPYQRFGYLEVIQVQASLGDIREQDEEWQPYYRKLGVHYTTFNPQISAAISTTSSVLRKEEDHTFMERLRLRLFAYKMAIRYRVVETFSSHASALVLGMLLGERDELSREEKNMFNQVGLSHILVVSGYNISLMISFVFILLKAVPKTLRISSALVIVGLFVLLIGYEPSVARAALMGSIIVFAKVSHRPGSALNVLFLVATVMVCLNPYGVFDAGLHLSFIATFSLLIMPEFKRVPEFVAVTLWVFVFVAPYVMYLSGAVSLAGIVTNLAVTFLLSIFMLTSLVAVTLSFLSVSVGIDVLLIETMARYVFAVSKTASHISSLILNTPPSQVTAGYVCVCATVLFGSSRYSVEEFIEKHYQRYAPQRPS